jgi:hypothetical protein
MMRSQIVGILMYASAALLALYSAPAALGVTFVMWVFWGVATKEDATEEI